MRRLGKKVLKSLYIDQWLSVYEIGKLLGCNASTVTRTLNAYRISMHASKIKGMSYASIYDLYVSRQWSTMRIADYFGCNDETVRQALLRNNINLRSRSEAGKIKLVSKEEKIRLKTHFSKLNLNVVGKGHPAWKGGRYTDKNGYVVVRRDKKNVREHRWIMEQHLGYKLNEWDEVHHVNGVKTDNRLENLEVIPNEHKHRDWIRRDKAS